MWSGATAELRELGVQAGIMLGFELVPLGEKVEGCAVEMCSS